MFLFLLLIRRKRMAKGGRGGGRPALWGQEQWKRNRRQREGWEDREIGREAERGGGRRWAGPF